MISLVEKQKITEALTLNKAMQFVHEFLRDQVEVVGGPGPRFTEMRFKRYGEEDVYSIYQEGKVYSVGIHSPEKTGKGFFECDCAYLGRVGDCRFYTLNQAEMAQFLYDL